MHHAGVRDAYEEVAERRRVQDTRVVEDDEGHCLRASVSEPVLLLLRPNAPTEPWLLGGRFGTPHSGAAATTSPPQIETANSRTPSEQCAQKGPWRRFRIAQWALLSGGGNAIDGMAAGTGRGNGHMKLGEGQSDRCAVSYSRSIQYRGRRFACMTASTRM